MEGLVKVELMHYWNCIVQVHAHILGRADFLQNFSERQIFLSLCSVIFHALTLKLPIQTFSFSQFIHVRVKNENFSKTNTPLAHSRASFPWRLEEKHHKN